MPESRRRKIPKRKRKVQPSSGARCGLCGRAGKLTLTECCGKWICDDADQYVLFSYARNSCYRNHDRFTLCGYHHMEGHTGRWQDCAVCRKALEPEMYAYFGTNEYNFEKLENPPTFEPKHCASCGAAISLANEGYSQLGGEYWCESCSMKRLDEILTKSRRVKEPPVSEDRREPRPAAPRRGRGQAKKR